MNVHLDFFYPPHHINLTKSFNYSQLVFIQSVLAIVTFLPWQVVLVRGLSQLLLIT